MMIVYAIVLPIKLLRGQTLFETRKRPVFAVEIVGHHWTVITRRTRKHSMVDIPLRTLPYGEAHTKFIAGDGGIKGVIFHPQGNPSKTDGTNKILYLGALFKNEIAIFLCDPPSLGLALLSFDGPGKSILHRTIGPAKGIQLFFWFGAAFCHDFNPS
jgi:hypothetical protein